MSYFVGLDVSLRSVALCIVDADGDIVLERALDCEVGAIDECLRKLDKPIAKLGFEAGVMSQMLFHGLQALGYKVVCMEARQVSAALSAMRNKTDKNDARGIVMTDDVLEFFAKHRAANAIIFSTSAEVANISDDVFNVTGSSHDPNIGGKSWKQLLKDNGIYGPCYVTNQKPDKPDTSHYKGTWLGGHMALTKNGVIKPGGTSYLMPLCSWHNSTSRDEKNFEHSKTKMLKLGGFMEGQNAFTFHMRRKDLGEYRVLHQEAEDWKLDQVAPTEITKSSLTTKGAALIAKPHLVLRLDSSKDTLTLLDGNF